MSNRDDSVTLGQILSHAQKALKLIQSKTRTQLQKDTVLSLALIRLLEVIGEAATRLSKEFRSQHKEIPWRKIIDLRNLLIHEYDEIDLDIVWVILTRDLPVLTKQIKLIAKNKR